MISLLTMKKLTFTAFAALLVFFIIQGCEKAQLTDLGVGTKIIASKTQITQFDLDTLLFTGAGACSGLGSSPSSTRRDPMEPSVSLPSKFSTTDCAEGGPGWGAGGAC